MKNAKPMPLPTVNPAKVQKMTVEQYLQSRPSKEPPESGDGVPPEVELEPNLTPLFKPISIETRTPNDYGTRKEQFSSSQLVPLSADLSYPYRAVGKLFFTIPGQGNYVCTASVIKPRVVLTAGHCVHSGANGNAGYYTNFRFVPAFRDGAAPYQSWSASYVSTTPDWMAGGGGVPNAADYAMLEMSDNTVNGVATKIASVTGSLGYQTSSLIPNHAHLLGYPCNFDSCAKMHQVTAESAVAISPNNAEYGSDMQGGSSGGPWAQNFGIAAVGQSGGQNPAMNRVIGVTSWGYINTASMGQGSAILDSRFTTLLNNLCAHKAGNC
jgi:V8-like Glu-specific endopeptidase